MTKYILILLITLGGLSIDFFSKKWAIDNLKEKPGITMVKNFVELGFAQNRGMVFGIFNGKMSQASSTLMISIRVLILIGVTVFIIVKAKNSLLFLLPFLLVWAGAVGNLIDSFLYGYVIDFIHIHAGEFLDWPYFFNIADAYVTIAMAMLIIYELTRNAKTVKSKKPV